MPGFTRHEITLVSATDIFLTRSRGSRSEDWLVSHVGMLNGSSHGRDRVCRVGRPRPKAADRSTRAAYRSALSVVVEDVGHEPPLAGSLLPVHYEFVLLLSRGLRLFLCRWPGRFLGSCLPEQSQGIRSIERVLADGPLASGTQSDVYATIARQEDRL
jgi:hypothetical protein